MCSFKIFKERLSTIKNLTNVKNTKLNIIVMGNEKNLITTLINFNIERKIYPLRFILSIDIYAFIAFSALLKNLDSYHNF